MNSSHAMTRNIFLFFFSLFFINSPNLFATTIIDCLSENIPSISQPATLEKFQQPTGPHELKRAGVLPTRPNELTHLPDGSYLYLMTSKGQFIYSERTPDLSVPPEGLHLATHRSLLAKLTEINQSEPHVIAAGEIKIHNSRVSEVNNRSGTFRGRKEHLHYAIKILINQGLKIEPGTEVLDFSTEQPNLSHLSESQTSELMIRYSNTPEWTQLLHLDKALSDRFPHPSTPGYMNVELLMKPIRELSLAEIKNLGSSNPMEVEQANLKMTALSNIQYIIKSLQTEGPGIIVRLEKTRHFPGGFELNDLINFLECLTQTVSQPPHPVVFKTHNTTLQNLRSALMQLLYP